MSIEWLKKYEFKKGHNVPQKWRENLKKTHRGKHYSPKTEFKKGQKSWNENKIDLKCSYCGKDIQRTKNEVKEKNYCSHQCYSINIKGHIGYWRGKKRPDISFNQIGEKNPNWKNGSSPENTRIRMGMEFRLWREAVFMRDNWTDQKTGIKGGKLHPHHIYNFSQYPKLRFDVNNGITLSKKSHIEFHKIYGRKNNTKEQIIEFLEELKPKKLSTVIHLTRGFEFAKMEQKVGTLKT